MTTLDEVRGWDAADPLRGFRARFRLPEGVIYLDGNSLGPLPRATVARLRAAVEEEWGDGLVRSWNDAGWVDAPARLGGKIARLIGARADEVIVADSTSIDLFKLAVAAAEGRPGAIVAEASGFPTDAYVAAGVARLLDRPFRAVPAHALVATMAGAAVAIVAHVDYRTATRHDMPALNAAAAARGCRVLWDLSHSTGAVPLDLARDRAELAVGCGYKYLNGGPGAPAFLYVAKAMQPSLASPIAGWWGHAAPFAFEPGFAPAPGIGRFQGGTPPMLGLLALEVGVDLMLEADPLALRDKAVRLHDLFAARVRLRCPELAVASPAEAAARGSHIALRHPHARAIVRAAIARGVIGDFRTPDIARFGFTPLTLRYEDAWQAAEILAGVMADGTWRAPCFADGGVVT